MKVDFNNPKFDLGTIVKATQDIPGPTKLDLIKTGQTFIITQLSPKPNQSPTGPHEYLFTQCSNKGTPFKKTIQFDQEVFEMDMAGGKFELFVKA